MTDKTNNQTQPISWLEYRSLRTGKSVEEIRAEMSERARLGGQARKGKKLSAEHKLKIGQGRKRHEGQQTPTEEDTAQA